MSLAITATTAVTGAALGAYGASEAASAAQAGQTEATNIAIMQAQIQQQQYEDLLKLGEPYRAAGEQGLAQYQAYTQDPSAMYQDPVYQAMLEQGTKAVEGSAAAKGTQLSGGTLAALQDVGMATASQYRSQIMGELANLANIGSTSVGQAYGVGGQQMEQTGAAYSNLANLAQQTGQIEASSILGATGGLTELAGTLGSAYLGKTVAPTTSTVTSAK